MLNHVENKKYYSKFCQEREVFTLKRIPASPMYICCHFLVFSVLSEDDNIIPFRLSSCLPPPNYSSISHGPRPEDLRNNDAVTNGQNNNIGPGEALENLWGAVWCDALNFMI